MTSQPEGHQPQLPVVFHPAYVASSIPAHHRFPMGKFGVLAQRLIADGIVAGEDRFFTPVPAAPRWLELAHDAAYVRAVLDATLDARAQRRIGFALGPDVVMRSRCAVAGTVLAARLALEHGIACNTAGGSHHADAAGGAGFCVFNDVAVAARLLLAEGLVSRVLVIDLDVHQGDGTARIFSEDDRVFTLSVHCEANWPRHKARSDLDIGLPEKTGDRVYLDTLDRVLGEVLDAARPGLVFYNAGVDPHRDDRLGLLDLSDDGLAAREAMVVERVRERSVPLCGVLGGGYAHDIDVLAGRHALLHKAAARALQRLHPA